MSWICLIGASERGAEAIRKCGHRVGVLADRVAIGKPVAEAAEAIIPVKVGDFSSVENGFETLVRLLGMPSAVLSFTELGLEAAGRLSEQHSLPTNPLDVIRVTRDKGEMRARLGQEADLALPHLGGKPDEIARELSASIGNQPWIIKPVEGYGSLSISLVSNRAELEAWHAEQSEQRDSRWIAEAFVSGPEYSVEAVSFAGRHTVLGITQKQTTGAPRFVETGHLFPAQLAEEDRARITAYVSRILTVLGVQVGATHTEVKLDPHRGPVVIETHTRPGGDCIPELAELATGIDQYEWAIRSLVGTETLDQADAAATGGAAIRFLQGAEGTLQAVSCEGELPADVVRLQIDTPLGGRIGAFDSSFSRMGYVIARSSTAAEAKDAVDTACRALTITSRPDAVLSR